MVSELAEDNLCKRLSRCLVPVLDHCNALDVGGSCTVDTPFTLALHPSYSLNRHDARCHRAGADRVAHEVAANRVVVQITGIKFDPMQQSERAGTCKLKCGI